MTLQSLNEQDLAERQQLLSRAISERIEARHQQQVENLLTDFRNHVKAFIEEKGLPENIGQNQAEEGLLHAALYQPAYLDALRLYFLDQYLDTLEQSPAAKTKK